MYNTFSDARVMNADFSSWDVSNVKEMQSTFKYSSTTVFTGVGLSKWNVAKVTNFDAMYVPYLRSSC
jgi:hypothetical protein